ncbi:MAG: DUF488 domain-containing protein [Gammaproteobacteria bacterium]|nr:DUF488 domain-containing protein [Gammaproteobacteria bacterium]MYF01957.1 DUF488 domain-containing protein [Gammaproteobacteria bacterium]MYI76223.1 DUF488 domain-containing protein [Gammaproteobacteria bacterium]
MVLTSSMQPIRSTFLFDREKKLIALLGELGTPVSRTDFQKLLFLFCSNIHRANTIQSVTSTYEFIPYKFGAFSFTSYHDRTRLEAKGVLDPTIEDWALTKYGVDLANQSRTDDVQYFVKQYNNIRGDHLIAETYRHSPFTAIKSQIIDRVLKNDPRTKRRIQATIPKIQHHSLFTIGYQQRTLENYINLLLQNCVNTLCDVRKNPVSRRYGFSKKTLSNACANVGITYTHLPQLGIESEHRKNLQDSISYASLFTRYRTMTLPKVEQTVDRISADVRSGIRLALTCFEREARECHRSVLADTIMSPNVVVGSIPTCSTGYSVGESMRVRHL